MPTAKRSAAGPKAPAPRPRAGTKKPTSRRLLACSLAAAAALLAPQAASASSSQLSLFEDERELLALGGERAAATMAEIRSLGVDVVRTNVIFGHVYRTPGDRRKPAGFTTSNPSSPQYDWSEVDRLVALARQNGIQLMFTITGPGPRFSSASPGRCRGVCTYKPKPSEFGGFAAAVARRYRGQIDYYSIFNEPNLGKTWLTPRFARSRGVRIDYAGMIYRKLWIAGYKAIAKYDRGRRNRVLFGETSAIASPLPMLRAALCLDPNGRPFTGRLRSAQGCSGRVGRLPIGGFAVHPYNQSGNGTPQQRTKTKTSLPMAYMPRLHRLMDGAARRGRIPRGKGVFITEFGFQSNPPDRNSNVSLTEQAQYLNESDRLFFGDRRVRSVAQYELRDAPQRDQFNMGLRFVSGAPKPSYYAYRVPLVVTRRSGSSVEVYGQVRPARLLIRGPRTTVALQVSRGGGAFTTVTNATTNRRGIFRRNVSRAGASRSRWRLVWQNPDNGSFLTSRVATPRTKLRYFSG